MASSIPIGVQLYSVRNECAQDLFGTIEKVAKMGYAGVEFAGFHGKSATDIKKCLDDNGIVCCGSHAGWDTLLPDKFEATVEFHKGIGCEYLIIPWIPEELRNSEAACVKLGADLTELVEQLTPLGLKTGFHVHGGDMKPLDTGKSAWQLIGMHTPAEFVLQYDTANGYVGGADPIQPILDFPGRGLTEHIKDWKKDGGPAIVGTGDIDFRKVVEACINVAGTKWYIIEHEDDNNPALDAVEMCLKNFTAILD